MVPSIHPTLSSFFESALPYRRLQLVATHTHPFNWNQQHEDRGNRISTPNRTSERFCARNAHEPAVVHQRGHFVVVAALVWGRRQESKHQWPGDDGPTGHV